MKLKAKNYNKKITKTHKIKSNKNFKFNRKPFNISTIISIFILSSVIFTCYLEINSFIENFEHDTKYILGII